MKSKISVIIGLLCVVQTFVIAVQLKPQNEPTDADDPNEVLVSFNSECLNTQNQGEVPMHLFNFPCIETNDFAFSTPNIIDPNDESSTYYEVAIFFKIGDDRTCLDNATVDHDCLVYVAYSPKIFWDGLDFSACLSDTTTGLPHSDAINLDLLNNIRPYLTDNDDAFDYFPLLNSDDPGVDIYAIERNINVNHIEFEGIRDQIVVDGIPTGDPSHGTQVLSVMIGVNYGILRGWPGAGANSTAYVYLWRSFQDIVDAFQLWTQTNSEYLQNGRRAVINLSFGMWRDSRRSAHRDWIQRLTNAIDTAIQLDAIVVASAGQDAGRWPWLINGANICQDTLSLRGLVGEWRRYPGSLPLVITAGAFQYAARDVQPTSWTHYGGSCVDLWAMGRGIIAPNGSTNTLYTSVSGTSFASPTIASLVAVELARNFKLKDDKPNKDDMVKRLKQCGRGFWIKPSTTATEIKCPQPDTCWAPSYICDKITCNKVDVALLVDVSKKMTTKECKRQQLEVAETLAGFRGIEDVTDGDLEYPRVRVSYIEFGGSSKVVMHINNDTINQHEDFNPTEALQTLCDEIRYSETCNASINRNDIPADLNEALTTALSQFEKTKTSDELEREKKMLIFSNHGTNDASTVCDNHETKIRTGSSKDSSEIERKDNENGVNVVMVNNRPDATMPNSNSYLMCLVEYDDERIMWNNVTNKHFPFIEKIHEEICEDPTAVPTTDPTIDPTIDPTFDPTRDPTRDPTLDPTIDPTTDPTINPTSNPTLYPTLRPTDPTIEPTFHPTLYPTSHPTLYPTFHPTTDPTIEPTFHPTTDPTIEPTFHPTSHPTLYPTLDPTGDPTEPTLDTTSTISPTSDPTTNPSRDPTIYPTRHPTTIPTSDPTTNPSRDPTTNPTSNPTITTISTPATSESQCKICEIQNGDCVHCGDEPWCTYDSFCVPDVDSGACVSISGQSECYCNDYETIETCPMGLKCTEQTHVGCWACDPCADDGVMKGHVGFESICYLDCDLNCVYETVNGDIKECVESQAHSTTTTSTLTCHDIGFDLRKGKKALPHDCQCQSECGGRYCNPFVWITEKLNYEFDIDDEELLCDDPGSMCCCSCPNCPGFLPFVLT